MKELTNPRWIKLKGLVGVLAGALLLVESPGIRTAGLLLICVWCFCRAYYFAFYVIEHYVDPGYRFSGLGSFLVYLLKRNKKP